MQGQGAPVFLPLSFCASPMEPRRRVLRVTRGLPGVTQGDGAVEYCLAAGAVVALVGDEISMAFELVTHFRRAFGKRRFDHSGLRAA